MTYQERLNDAVVFRGGGNAIGNLSTREYPGEERYCSICNGGSTHVCITCGAIITQEECEANNGHCDICW